MRTIIKNAHIVTGETKELLNNIYIDNGRFSQPFEPDNKTQVIDADGKTVIPGLCDIHVHFRDPGLTHKEDIITGSKAAARGGFTTVCMMPNTAPPIDNVDTLKYVDSKGREAGFVNVLATSAMTIGQAGKKLCDFHSMDGTMTRCKEITGHGIAAITEDGMTLSNAELMEDVCKIAKELNLVIMDHAEPEIEVVKRDIELSRKYGCKMHIQHISKAETVKLISAAKAEGLAVTAEAAPHHFALNDDAINEHGVNAKMNPPLASEKDRIAVLEGLLDDTIDVIATDHAPHAEDEKNGDYAQAPNGIIGLETAFPVAYTTLVKSGKISIEKLVEKMSVNPLKLISAKGITSANRIGAPADLAIVDINEEYEIHKNEFCSKARNTPFHGMKVYGKVLTTIHNGNIVWNETNN